MKKKIIALLSAMCILLLTTACDEVSISSEPIDLGKTIVFTAGKVASVGDVFVLPEISTTTTDGSPVLSEITAQANPGDHLTCTGEGFSAQNLKAYIYAQSTADNGKAYEAEYEYVGDNQIVVKIPSDIEYGMYAVYVVTDKGTSNVKYVNRPVIWWNSFTLVKCGESVTVYGENLTTDNGESETNIWLVGDNEFCNVEVTYADPYKVTFTVPEGLIADSEYGITLHNGHGGDCGFAEAPEKIKITETRDNDFSGNIINVIDHGALPDDKENDDTAAIRTAINKAQDGDVVYFPKGTYLIDSPISINKSIKLEGESFENTNIVAGINIDYSSNVIKIAKGPVEIFNLSFVNIRDTGKLPRMILFGYDDGGKSGSWVLNVHNCRYTALESKYVQTGQKFVSVTNSSGVIFANNDVASPGMFSVYATNLRGVSEKVFVTGNRYYGQCYDGSYYDGMNCMTINSVDKADISNNYFASADILIDDTHVHDTYDLINGRSMSIQGLARRFYIAKNKIEASDILGDSCGEQIMSEGDRACFVENASVATTDTVTLPSFSTTKITDYYNRIPNTGSILYVAKGKGCGQVRVIKEINDNIFTIETPWDIIPDETSVITVSTGHYNWVIYKNDITGAANHSVEGGGGCGIMIYNDVYNFRVVENTIADVNTGIYLEQHAIGLTTEPYGSFNSSVWCILSGNNISDANVGIRSMMNGSNNLWESTAPFYVQIGVTIRRNTISEIVDWTRANLVGIGGVGIMYSRNTGDYNNTTSTPFEAYSAPWQYGTVIENNKFLNCVRANILMGMHQGSTVLLNNIVEGTVKDIYTLDNEYADKPLICK